MPFFEELLRPVLALSAKEDITRRGATVVMTEEHQLTKEEREELLPSGSATTSRSS